MSKTMVTFLASTGVLVMICCWGGPIDYFNLGVVGESLAQSGGMICPANANADCISVRGPCLQYISGGCCLFFVNQAMFQCTSGNGTCGNNTPMTCQGSKYPNGSCATGCAGGRAFQCADLRTDQCP